MSTQLPNSDDRKHWESVHVCPKCEHIINLAQIDGGFKIEVQRI